MPDVYKKYKCIRNFPHDDRNADKQPTVQISFDKAYLFYNNIIMLTATCCPGFQWH